MNSYVKFWKETELMIRKNAFIYTLIGAVVVNISNLSITQAADYDLQEIRKILEEGSIPSIFFRKDQITLNAMLDAGLLTTTDSLNYNVTDYFVANPEKDIIATFLLSTLQKMTHYEQMLDAMRQLGYCDGDALKPNTIDNLQIISYWIGAVKRTPNFINVTITSSNQ